MGNGKTGRRSNRRKKFRRAQEAMDQVLSIRRAQRHARGRPGTIIDSTQKSDDGFRNRLRRIDSRDDVNEHFD